MERKLTATQALNAVSKIQTAIAAYRQDARYWTIVEQALFAFDLERKELLLELNVESTTERKGHFLKQENSIQEFGVSG
jgi:hypothetical protein